MTSTGIARLPENDALSQLAENASLSKLGGLEYSGEVSPRETYEFLQHNAALLIDVRTIPEWQFTGIPYLAGTPSKLLTISWKIYPSFAQNPQFADLVASAPGINKDTPLFFICRSGGRSLDAAVEMSAQGYRYCFNVAGGFEGETNNTGHRGESAGWKAASLPWVQE